MSAQYDYVRDGAEIYRRSFAIIRSEADLSRFTPDEARVAVRVIHACGMVEIARDLVFSPGFVEAARGALLQGKPIFCDSKMVANGITRARLPADNEIVCTLDDSRHRRPRRSISTPRAPPPRSIFGSTGSAARSSPSAMRRQRCSGFSSCIDQGAPKPAAIIGMPVGFVGAAESKEALASHGGVPFLIVKGRKGGSAMAVAAVNALASEAE